MSTPRIQVLLRPNVYALVKQKSEESGVTLSKTVSQLVELALESEGSFDRKTQARPEAKGSFSDFVQATAAHSDKRSQLVARKTETIEPSDLDLLNKLKKLKALEEAGII